MVYTVCEDTFIEGKKTTYIISMWDGKTNIVSNELVGEYTDQYDKAQEIARLLNTICDYLNSKKATKVDRIKMFFG
jgi:hypothetical protein